MSRRKHAFPPSQLELLAPNGDSGEPPPPFRASARDFLALAEKDGIGRASLSALVQHFRPLEAVWTADPAEIADVLHQGGNKNAYGIAPGLRRDRPELLARADETLDTFRRARIAVLFRDDPEYPARLRDAKGPPFLFAQGAVSLLSRVSTVGIVGTRAPTERGIRAAHRVARVACEAGFVVVSGLAEGIDTEAHQTAAHRGGKTVAVLGNGFAIDFPASNRELRREIVVTGGALVSEYLPRESYSRSSFVQRNRIIAALSSVVVPVEGKVSGGTAHTVRFARELQRPLVALTSPDLPPDPDSLLTALAQEGAPQFSLDTPADVARFLAFLAPYATDAVPPSSETPEQLRRVYHNVLRQLASVVRHREPTPAEQEWLLKAVQRILSAREGE